MTTESRRASRHASRGQGLVEFAFVAPIALVVITGIFVSCFLFFQNSAVTNGATAGSRMAPIETSLVTVVGAQICESSLPISIEAAVAQAASQLKVNPARLCETSATHLSQRTVVANEANITVDATTDVAGARWVTVTGSFSGTGIAPPLTATYAMTAKSTVPVLAP
jgi:Flp pilus assembly protein TadG